MKKITMQPSAMFRPGHTLPHMMGQRMKLPEKKTGTFLVSNHNIGGNSMKMLHLMPDFMKLPDMYNYEISGSDGFKMDGMNNLNKTSDNSKIIVSFNCRAGETYFCKVIAYYSKSKTVQQTQQPEYDTEEFRLFYKVKDDFDDDVEVSEEQDADTEIEEDDVEDVEVGGDVSDTEIATIKEYMFSQGTGLDLKDDDDQEEEVDISKI